MAIRRASFAPRRAVQLGQRASGTCSNLDDLGNLPARARTALRKFRGDVAQQAAADLPLRPARPLLEAYGYTDLYHRYSDDCAVGNIGVPLRAQEFRLEQLYNAANDQDL